MLSRKEQREEIIQREMLQLPKHRVKMGEKDQLLWKKLGYHGNFVNMKKKCYKKNSASLQNRVSKFKLKHLTKHSVAVRKMEGNAGLV